MTKLNEHGSSSDADAPKHNRRLTRWEALKITGAMSITRAREEVGGTLGNLRKPKNLLRAGVGAIGVIAAYESTAQAGEKSDITVQQWQDAQMAFYDATGPILNVKSSQEIKDIEAGLAPHLEVLARNPSTKQYAERIKDTFVNARQGFRLANASSIRFTAHDALLAASAAAAEQANRIENTQLDAAPTGNVVIDVTTIKRERSATDLSDGAFYKGVSYTDKSGNKATYDALINKQEGIVQFFKPGTTEIATWASLKYLQATTETKKVGGYSEERATVFTYGVKGKSQPQSAPTDKALPEAIWREEHTVAPQPQQEIIIDTAARPKTLHQSLETQPGIIGESGHFPTGNKHEYVDFDAHTHTQEQASVPQAKIDLYAKVNHALSLEELKEKMPAAQYETLTSFVEGAYETKAEDWSLYPQRDGKRIVAWNQENGQSVLLTPAGAKIFADALTANAPAKIPYEHIWNATEGGKDAYMYARELGSLNLPITPDPIVASKVVGSKVAGTVLGWIANGIKGMFSKETKKTVKKIIDPVGTLIELVQDTASHFTAKEILHEIRNAPDVSRGSTIKMHLGQLADAYEKSKTPEEEEAIVNLVVSARPVERTDDMNLAAYQEAQVQRLKDMSGALSKVYELAAKKPVEERTINPAVKLAEEMFLREGGLATRVIANQGDTNYVLVVGSKYQDGEWQKVGQIIVAHGEYQTAGVDTEGWGFGVNNEARKQSGWGYFYGADMTHLSSGKNEVNHESYTTSSQAANLVRFQGGVILPKLGNDTGSAELRLGTGLGIADTAKGTKAYEILSASATLNSEDINKLLKEKTVVINGVSLNTSLAHDYTKHTSISPSISMLDGIVGVSFNPRDGIAPSFLSLNLEQTLDKLAHDRLPQLELIDAQLARLDNVDLNDKTHAQLIKDVTAKIKHKIPVEQIRNQIMADTDDKNADDVAALKNRINQERGAGIPHWMHAKLIAFIDHPTAETLNDLDGINSVTILNTLKKISATGQAEAGKTAAKPLSPADFADMYEANAKQLAEDSIINTQKPGPDTPTATSGTDYVAITNGNSVNVTVHGTPGAKIFVGGVDSGVTIGANGQGIVSVSTAGADGAKTASITLKKNGQTSAALTVSITKDTAAPGVTSTNVGGVNVTAATAGQSIQANINESYSSLSGFTTSTNWTVTIDDGFGTTAVVNPANYTITTGGTAPNYTSTITFNNAAAIPGGYSGGTVTVKPATNTSVGDGANYISSATTVFFANIP